MKRTCLIIGARDTAGAAIAHAFTNEGLTVCMAHRLLYAEELEDLAADIRRKGKRAFAFPVDVQDEEAVLALFKHIESELGSLEVVIFNIDADVKVAITETSTSVYRNIWEMAAFAGFLAGREAARHMVPRERGMIVFTGTSASLRGAAGLSAFAGARHALRALAQSMARELGPKNIHVAHVVIDNPVDQGSTRDEMQISDDNPAKQTNLNPDHIARAYVNLYKQPRSGWTDELDLRTNIDKW
ncbi:MAG: SDR family NAD(P)-dependent oxidoreductase [Maricaulaceae bacterium]